MIKLVKFNIKGEYELTNEVKNIINNENLSDEELKSYCKLAIKQGLREFFTKDEGKLKSNIKVELIKEEKEGR